MHGRDWPCLRQFCVFLENRVGQLNDLLRQVETADTRIYALTIVDSVDFAITRLIFSNSDRAREKLELLGFHFTENDVVGVVLPEGDSPFTVICQELVKAEVNIHHTYPLQYRKQGRLSVVISVDDVDAAVHMLREAGLEVLTEGDLLEGDEF